MVKFVLFWLNSLKVLNLTSQKPSFKNSSLLSTKYMFEIILKFNAISTPWLTLLNSINPKSMVLVMLSFDILINSHQCVTQKMGSRNIMEFLKIPAKLSNPKPSMSFHHTSISHQLWTTQIKTKSYTQNYSIIQRWNI